MKSEPTHQHPFPKNNDDERTLLEHGFQRNGEHYLIYNLAPDHYMAVDVRDARWSLGSDAAGEELNMEGLWRPRDMNDVILLIKIFETASK